MTIKVINLDTPTLGDRSYIAHDGKVALVVDPQRDIDRVNQILSDQGLSLGAVVETHMHNDYVSGGLVLSREHGVPYIVSELDPVAFDRQSIKDNEVISVGSFAIRGIHTPGHTFTHMSYALINESQKVENVFTGGSMLHGSTGRPDLLGWDHARELAGLQHGSAHHLVEVLGDDVSIHPTHGFGSFCSASATTGDSSIISGEKKTNPVLLLDKEAYISSTLAGLDVFPAYYKYMGPINHQGAAAIDLSELSRMSTEEIMLAIKSGAWVVDLRDRKSWTESHLRGTMSFGVDGSFATYLGWMFPYENQLVLISDKAGDIAQAQRELVRIGIDRPAGSFVGDLSQFSDLSTIKTVRFADIPVALSMPGTHILDVRRTSEREGSHIVSSLHIPLHELESRVNELPTDGEIWVHCAGAYRASAALGIIEGANRRPVLINEPYEAALLVKDLNIVQGVRDSGPTSPSDSA